MALGRNHKIFNIGNASGTIQGLTRVYHDLSLSGDGTLSSLLGVVGDKADAEVNQYVYDNSATIDEVNTSYQTNSGNFLTAIPDYYATTGDINDLAQSISETYQVKGDYVERNDMDSAIESATSGKLDASSFASVSGDFLVASSLNGYATESFVEETSGAITSLIPTDYYPDTNPSAFVNEDWVTAQGYITGVDLTPYQTTAGMTAYATTGDVANKLDTTAFSNVSSTFLTAHQIIPSAKWENASDIVESNSAQWSENTGDEEVNNAVYNNSAKWNDISVYQSNSSTYLTAHQDISNKLDTTAFSEVSGDFLTTAFEISQSAKWEEATNAYEQNSGTYLTAISIPESATWNEVSTTVQSNSADWASHQDLSYISAQVDNKLDSSSFVPNDFYPMTGNPSGFLTEHQDWTDTITAASANAYNEAIAQIPPQFDPTYISGVIDNKLNITAFSDVSGSFLTAVSIPESADWSETTDVVQTNSGKWNDITAYQNASGTYLTAINIPESANWNEATSVVETNSAAWGNEFDPTFMSGAIDNKLDTNSFTAWSAAQAANAFKLSAGNGINLIDDSINKITRIDVTAGAGDVGVNTYVQTNSANINNAVSTYQTNSANYLTAHQDISNKLDITTFTSWSATQEANDYELSAGNGVTLYDDSVNKITRIDVTATGGDEEVNTLVHSNSSTWNDVTNKLDKSESANYYPRTGNPSKFIPQSALNLKIGKISGIGGSAFSVGNHNAVTFPLSDGFGGIDIGIPYDNGYLQYLCTDHISEVTLTTMPKVGNYKISANSAEYIIPGNSWITFYEQRNSEGQYRWAIKDYNGSGVLTSATSTTTGGGGGGDMSTTLLEYNVNNQITGYAGSAIAGGGGGNPEVESYVQTNSATIDEVNSTVQTNSASWGQGGGVTYSAGEYIDITDNTISVTGVTDLVAGNAITITTSGTSAIISSNGEAQVQSDWNVTDTNSKAYIKNKPTIPAAQIQSDWNQTNTNAKDYIKNKPSIPSYTGASGINVSSNIVSLDNPIGLVAGDNITITVSGISAIISANAGDDFPVSADEACQYVVSNSSTIDEVNTEYQANSATYLTAHQDLSDYQTTAGMTAYQPVGDYATTADLALKQDTLTFGYDEGNNISSINNSAIGCGVSQSAFDELKQSYDALSASYATLSSLFATYSGQWLLPNEGV